MKLHTEKNDTEISQVILGQKSKTETDRMNQKTVPVIHELVFHFSSYSFIILKI